jgi:hypothetical protein
MNHREPVIDIFPVIKMFYLMYALLAYGFYKWAEHEISPSSEGVSRVVLRKAHWRAVLRFK